MGREDGGELAGEGKKGREGKGGKEGMGGDPRVFKCSFIRITYEPNKPSWRWFAWFDETHMVPFDFSIAINHGSSKRFQIV